MDAANYTCREELRDGTPVEIRSLRPDDEGGMLAALDQVSARTLLTRFFAPKRHISDKERAYFMQIDFKSHVALVACAPHEGRAAIIGGGRYIMSEPNSESMSAEMAFVVIDAWQGRGIGSLLAKHLIVLAREAGLKELTAEVLPENAAMRRVFDRLGFRRAATRDPQVIHLALALG
ncbi:N-acetyltransferase family protein [Bradyrhizobium sp. 18BD]